MSKYTTELRHLVESGFDLGLKDYPIFNENYRETLNKKIIEHYYFREIGVETAALFKRFLNRTMNEIMPYYNQMYKSELLAFDPLSTKSLLETYSKEMSGNASQEASGNQSTLTNGENTSRSIYSDTPQSNLLVGEIENNVYATNATVDKNTGVTDTNSTNSALSETITEGKEVFNRNFSGYEGNSSELLKSFRSTFLNIDMLVIEELNSLFMGLW